MKVGIIGLPNVGKSTIFNALTSSDIPASNYPFCTISSNVGTVNVPDKRLQEINQFIKTKSIISTTIEFIDIAGLVKGASKGEGLGNQFLSNIRNVDTLVHVVRCFENSDIAHVEGDIDPLRDIQIIETELMLKDLERLNKRLSKVQKLSKSNDKQAKEEIVLLESAIKLLDQGKFLFNFAKNESEKKIIDSWFLLTTKPILYLCNIDEENIKDIQNDKNYSIVNNYANEKNINCLVLCGNIEMEISKIDNQNDKNSFLEIYNLKEPSLNRLITLAYKELGLITFFTAGPQEIKAWSIPKNTLAPAAAGTIHTDFERGFIKAEVYTLNDLLKYKSEIEIKENGKIRQEGKNYIIKDSDIIFFKFNV